MTSLTKPWTGLFLLLSFCSSSFAYSLTSETTPDSRRYVHVAAKDRTERSAIADAGMSIEAVRSDSVWGFANPAALERLQAKGFNVLGTYPLEVGRGGHEGLFDFPGDDKVYHTYDRLLSDLRAIEAKNSDIFRVESIGKSIEGRDLWAVHINTSHDELVSGRSTKPGSVIMGNHHAREHLTVEIPLKLAAYLMDHRRAPNISRLLDSRDIWIIPMVNPDGSEFDVSTDTYQYWRKNRRDNKDGTFGVDLNRNYGFHWGTGGSSSDSSSDVFMGPKAFSEPETQTVRDFVRSQKNIKTLLTLHTFSELILYPWGYLNDEISNARDLAAFKKMAQTMAKWNHYTAEASHELYTTSGDTVDWAYGELGIFAFTFEMSPSMTGGPDGFYPGPQMIDKAFNDNLNPCLYLIQMAGDPYATLDQSPSRWLPNYAEPNAWATENQVLF